MIKPKRLNYGDKIAVVSLSWGGLGDEELKHKFDIAEKRLREDFGLKVIVMPHALKGSEFVYRHPELRAEDLMKAFADKDIKAVICAIGGDDTIRTLPYIDFNIICSNPKIFMGYSDSTINHFMMYKAGLVSFYGPSVMCEFGEYVQMAEYTHNAVQKFLFEDTEGYCIKSSPVWSDSFIPWKIKNIGKSKKLKSEKHGCEVLQGSGKVTGHLLGGCIDVFQMAVGTPIFPTLEQWNGAILFIETSEEKLAPEFVKYALRNLAAQGVIKVLNGIIVGKPQDEIYYQEYKEVITQVVTVEEGREDLPIFYNINIGHAYPTGILPLGIKTELDCDEKSITLLESATEAD